MEDFTNFLFDQWPLSLAFAFIAILLGRSFLEPMLTGVKNIKAQDAVRIMNDENTVVLDVRLEKEYKEGHIIDAIHIPVGALASRIRELDGYKANTMVIYCHTGMRSKQAGGILKKHGFTEMYSIDGGIGAWSAANLPVNKTTKKKSKKSKND